MWSIMALVRYLFIISCTPPFENNNFTTSAPPLLDPPHDPHGTQDEQPGTRSQELESRVLITVVQVPRERGELLARQHSMAFMETSARTGVNVAQVSVTLNLN